MGKKKIIILGSGPTGLITAWRLLERGFDVEIIEKNSNSGGLCRSWKYKDFIIDISGSLENNEGKKDLEKINKLLNLAKEI